MRAIFNIHSNRAAKAAGWRAKEIFIKGKREATLDEILKATPLADSGNMHGYIIQDDLILDDWRLYVNGITVSGPLCIQTSLKDNTQIHLTDNV